MDEISKRILKIIYGLGIEQTASPSEMQIPPHSSSSGLRVIMSDVPKTTFYRKLKFLEKDGYITTNKKKKLSKYYEIINGQRISIPSRYTKAREVKLTEKGKEIVSEFLTYEFSRKIVVIANWKVKKMLFIDAVEYLRSNFGVEIHTAFFHLLCCIEERRFPIDLEKLGEEISNKAETID
ncbi:MAG: hypothetical protein HXS54_09795 [Theionarchaea archaeon]|nr:hypothetical protein [Theionarchaea archaeon]